jgi:hypothetical protein
MLVIFTFSITPKTFWHKCLADHGENASVIDDKTTVHKTNFDCHCDELVITAAFTQPAIEVQISSPRNYKEFNLVPCHLYLPTTRLSKDLRGPPAVA